MPTARNIELKKLYYLDHFFEMLAFVVKHNSFLLEESHQNFIERFHDLNKEDQCLFVRLANRKGTLFRLDRVVYGEISNIEGSVSRLKEAGFFRDPEAADLRGYLGCMTRPELLQLVKDLEGCPATGSMKKSDLVEYIQQNLDFSAVLTHQATPGAVALDRCVELEYLLFLYFGRLEGGLGVFALRDLGIVKTRQAKSAFQARFPSKDISLAAFHYRKVRGEINGAELDELVLLAGCVNDWPVVDDSEVNSSRHRAIHKLGRALERGNSLDLALSVFLQSDRFPSTERAVRLLYQSEQKDAAGRKLVELIENPSTDEELIFAEDFYERKFGERKLGRLTELLRGARVLPLDESGREYPERAAVSYLERSGAKAFHVENVIWSQLFGVVFWEVLFGSDSSAIHSDFDRLPSGLNSDRFYIENQSFVEGRILELAEPGWIDAQIESVADSLEGNPNYLVYDDPAIFELTKFLVAAAPEGALETILREMAQDFRSTRSGFPDLVVFENHSVRFVEIKAEGDQIQRHQLVQIERLRRAGFSVEVARIQWTVDPDQEYVVVDVETTGGNPSWNRVTEIGAVKIRGGKVIGEWSSLINPGRKIPQNIVRLTGITDEMVVGAPAFSDVGDQFREFLGAGVFVAHRATFDFGFIREEYRRIDEDLRAPIFCTVVETRRYFPGLKSYGLANLCKEFGINLDSHHRALCDAKATAELLLKINKKRAAICSATKDWH